MFCSHCKVSHTIVALAATSLVFVARCGIGEAFSRHLPHTCKVRRGSLSATHADIASSGNDLKKPDVVPGPRSSGPKSDSTRRGRRGSSSPASPSVGRRRAPPVAKKRERAPHQFDHTKEEARPFVDALAAIRTQDPNEGAPALDLPGGSDGREIERPHFEFRSLDDLFPNLDFSRKFARSKEFRAGLRSGMREDIFDTTPLYQHMSEKARKMLLLPDTSLQSSWRCSGGGWTRPDDIDGSNSSGGLRMKRLTVALRSNLGPDSPTGDEFMDTIGSLCGPEPQTHWIDIVGVLDRRIPHSWHGDTGSSYRDSKTVLLAFPPEDDYDGVGVYDHLIKLKRERRAPEGLAPNEPVLFGRMEDVGDEYIVRPRFSMGRELMMYRDVDVLQSCPDIAYRSSLMKFV